MKFVFFIARYIMITHHSSYARIYKTHWIAVMIAFCWICAYGVQLPTLFGVWGEFKWNALERGHFYSDSLISSGAFGYDKNLGTCSILKDSHGRSSKTTLFVTAFLIPCIIIIGCYARIFWVVHKWVESIQFSNVNLIWCPLSKGLSKEWDNMRANKMQFQIIYV